LRRSRALFFYLEGCSGNFSGLEEVYSQTALAGVWARAKQKFVLQPTTQVLKMEAERLAECSICSSLEISAKSSKIQAEVPA
jgi:hypothetical protein